MTLSDAGSNTSSCTSPSSASGGAFKSALTWQLWFESGTFYEFSTRSLLSVHVILEAQLCNVLLASSFEVERADSSQTALTLYVMSVECDAEGTLGMRFVPVRPDPQWSINHPWFSHNFLNNRRLNRESTVQCNDIHAVVQNEAYPKLTSGKSRLCVLWYFVMFESLASPQRCNFVQKWMKKRGNIWGFELCNEVRVVDTAGFITIKPHFVMLAAVEAQYTSATKTKLLTPPFFAKRKWIT